MYENDWYAWYFLVPNKTGFTHVLHDKIKELWYIVHASGCEFEGKKNENLIEFATRFIV